MNYTPKQIEKYNRQKYIVFLEKITKNVFKILKNENSTTKEFLATFHRLYGEFLKLVETRLDTEYHKSLKEYIFKLYLQSKNIDFDVSEIREDVMSELNRLQKLKTRKSYKKDKHKYSYKNEYL